MSHIKEFNTSGLLNSLPVFPLASLPCYIKRHTDSILQLACYHEVTSMSQEGIKD